MGFTKLRMTRSCKAEQMVFELFTELPNHALTEIRIHAFRPTCLVRKSASISLAGFLHHLAFSDPSLAPRGTLCRCVSLEPSSAPNRNSSCGVHPHMSFEFPSPVQENALQAKHLRCCAHQTTILRFAGAEPNHGLSLAVSHQHSMRVTRFCHLNNQTNLGRVPRTS